MSEIWSDIPGWEGRYQASTGGRIRSLDMLVGASYGGSARRRGRMLKIVPRPVNYRFSSERAQVSLTQGKRRCTCFVSALVAATFLGPRPSGKYVAHRNDDALDNRIENLYYATPAENWRDSVRNGKRVPGWRAA